MSSYPFTFDSDRPMTVCGVPGRLTHRTTRPTMETGALWTKQKWVSEARSISGDGQPAKIIAEIRFDDDCNNGHNTFAITGSIYRKGQRGDRDWLGGGCCHDDIAKAFPELAHLIRWHLFDSDKGPMHGVANAIYHASDRDHWGRRYGDVSRSIRCVQFGDNPAACPLPRGLEAFLVEIGEYDRDGKEAALIPIAVAHKGKPGETYKFKPKWQYAGQPVKKWHECPFDSEEDAARFAAGWLDHAPKLIDVAVEFSEGKPRDFEAARRAAAWPDATDAQLSLPADELRPILEARLPALIAEFRADIEAAGFVWAPSEFKGTPRDE